MKKIELTTEWILDKLSTGWIMDGKGNCFMQVDLADGVLESHLVELALKTMGINYENNTIGYDPDPVKAEAIDEYVFNIKEIENECPNLFAEMYEQDSVNAKIPVIDEHGNFKR
jgi:hypothetical protein